MSKSILDFSLTQKQDVKVILCHIFSNRLFSQIYSNAGFLIRLFLSVIQDGTTVTLMGGKQHSFARMEHNSRRQCSCVIGGSTFDATSHRCFMKSILGCIANRKLIQRSHIVLLLRSSSKTSSIELNIRTVKHIPYLDI